MALLENDTTTKARVGFSKNGDVSHIIDDWAPETARRISDVAFCGTRVVESIGVPEVFCRRCVAIVRNYDRELRRKQQLPNQKAINACLSLIQEASTVELAKVIPLIPRR